MRSLLTVALWMGTLMVTLTIRSAPRPSRSSPFSITFTEADAACALRVWEDMEIPSRCEPWWPGPSDLMTEGGDW